MSYAPRKTAPDLAPVPVPQICPLSALPETMVRECLQQTEPIADFDHLALHVAMLTLTLRELLERIEELETPTGAGKARRHERNRNA
jgi:hypothetical protein